MHVFSETIKVSKGYENFPEVSFPSLFWFSADLTTSARHPKTTVFHQQASRKLGDADREAGGTAGAKKTAYRTLGSKTGRSKGLR